MTNTWEHSPSSRSPCAYLFTKSAPSIAPSWTGSPPRPTSKACAACWRSGTPACACAISCGGDSGTVEVMKKAAVGVVEVRAQIECFKRILALEKGARREPIGQALVRFGTRFLKFMHEAEKIASPENAVLVREVREEAEQVLLEWLVGETF